MPTRSSSFGPTAMPLQAAPPEITERLYERLRDGLAWPRLTSPTVLSRAVAELMGGVRQPQTAPEPTEQVGRFVDWAYAAILGRPVEAPLRDALVGRMRRLPWLYTRRGLMRRLMTSDEANASNRKTPIVEALAAGDTPDFIRQAHRVTQGREPTPAEDHRWRWRLTWGGRLPLAWLMGSRWAGSLAAAIGVSLHRADVMAALLDTPQGQAHSGVPEDPATAFVRWAYQTVLGRLPEPTSLRRFAWRLRWHPLFTRQALLSRLLDTPEYRLRLAYRIEHLHDRVDFAYRVLRQETRLGFESLRTTQQQQWQTLETRHFEHDRLLDELRGLLADWQPRPSSDAGRPHNPIMSDPVPDPPNDGGRAGQPSDAGDPRAEGMACRVCGGQTAWQFSRRVLHGRYEAHYRRCQVCQTLQVPNPHWLAEAYRNEANPPVWEADTGRLVRNFSIYGYLAALRTAEVLCGRNPAAAALADPTHTTHTTPWRDSRWLDFGGGFGLLTRMLRDAGADAWMASDDMSRPFMAVDRRLGDLDSLPAESFDVVTAFEVFEHLSDPLDTARRLRRVLRPGGSLVISTELYRPDRHGPDWPYLAVRGGQHITLYTAAGIGHIAANLGLASVGYFPGDGGLLIVLSALPQRELASGLQRALAVWRGSHFAAAITDPWQLTQRGHITVTEPPRAESALTAPGRTEIAPP